MKYFLKKTLEYIIFSERYYILAVIFRLLIRERTPQGQDKYQSKMDEFVNLHHV